MSIFEDKGVNTTSIESLGEFGLIDHLTNGITTKNSSTVKGIGDDAAVIDMGDKYQLVSTDLLVEGVHFDLAYMPLKHLGYKAVSVNISDICAMNGKSTQITVSIAISNRFSVEAVEELYSGIKLACEKFNVDLVGGDTTSSTAKEKISQEKREEDDISKGIVKFLVDVYDEEGETCWALIDIKTPKPFSTFE